MLKNLGKRIRELRKAKGITLVEMSQKTGVAQATLSRIETGIMIGTVESHVEIAEVLGISLAELYSGIDRRYQEIAHLAPGDAKKVTHHTKGIQIELLTQESSKKNMTPLLLTMAEKSKTSQEQLERGTEKFFYLAEGEIAVQLENREYLLKEGETLYFDASLPHRLINDSDRTAKIIAVVCPRKS